MRTMILSLFSLILVAAAPASADDHKRIQGAWNIVSFKDADLNNPKAQPKEMRIVIAREEMSITMDGKGQQATFKLDPDKKPKQIDLLLTKNKKRPNLGIYELDGDRLKIAVGGAGDPRATEFEPLQKSPQGYLILIVLKREK